jgi:hypothetical protein
VAALPLRAQSTLRTEPDLTLSETAIVQTYKPSRQPPHYRDSSQNWYPIYTDDALSPRVTLVARSALGLAEDKRAFLAHGDLATIPFNINRD